MSHAYTLISQSLPFGIGHFALKGGRVLVGRSLKCDFYVNDLSVSRRHAEISAGDTGVQVTDLNSRNGTYLDEERVTTCIVSPGQRLRFGNVVCLLLSAQDADNDPHSDLETPCPTTRAALDEPELVASLPEGKRRILGMFLKGLSEKQIAAALDLSPHTVHNHVRAIYRVFGVHSRSELLIMLLQTKRWQGVTL